MKKKLALVLALLMLATLAMACAKKPAAEDDLSYIKSKGVLKVGITFFAPMNYYDESGKLVGFETEFAEALCAKLGVTPEFIEINWDTKEVELAAKNIDCIWNGLTVTEERKENMDFSSSYIKNLQVAVIRAADAAAYATIESLAAGKLVAEIGSAGESAILEDEVLKGAAYTAVAKQTDALLEVKAGTADVAILDSVAAKALVGAGTSYADLLIVPGVELAVEEYAIGFRVGSTAVPDANKLIAELIADGTLDAIAAKYDLTESLLSNQ
ncbi:MAG: transporter substrate-binding domain-containing protein [Christensenellaceae bacterium]|jgi:polar amino acid transport system substrate-binding protein|nr:transporter substrate-binding domain-containing protein [Christensenellaceae bacterium]